MKQLFILLFTGLVILIASTIAIAQPIVDTTGISQITPANDLTTLHGMLNWYNALFGALVLVWGYIAKGFGLKAKVNNFVWVVVAGAVVIGATFLAIGVTKAIPLLFSFLGAIGIYDIFLKPGSKLLQSQKS